MPLISTGLNGYLVATVCRDSKSGIETGRYLFSEMNTTLERCPGLAAKLPFPSVDTCEQAGIYVNAHNDYASQNPGGGCDIAPSFVAIVFVEGGIESHPSAMLADPNYDSQFPDIPNPVVKITTLEALPNGQLFERSECSGTFIAKNWILTAGHCFADEEKIVRGGYRNWMVRWGGDSVVRKIAYQKAFRALQIPHPTVLDRATSNTDPGQLDLGLLYLPVSDLHDRFLPPDISTHGGYLATDATSRLFSPNPDLQQAGWGKVYELNTTTVPITITVPTVAPHTVPQETVVTDARLVFAALNPPDAQGNGHRVCRGDSGGPLYWVEGTHPVILAVTRRVPGMQDMVDCGFPDSFVGYVRVDTPGVRTWINTEMAKQLGEAEQLQDPAKSARAARCRVDEDNDAFYKCWRYPCDSNSTCVSDEICVGSAADYAKAVCDPAICGGGCSCIVGSCVTNWAVYPSGF